MQAYFYAFGRGRGLTVREYDIGRDVYVYFRWSKIRKHREMTCYAFEAMHDGGIQFRVYRDGQVQGWRLRGPIQHFEGGY